jgi:hypothetical protein
VIQFYLLSVLLDVFGGCALVIDLPKAHGPAIEGLRSFFKDKTVRLVLGILAAVTGALKLVATLRGDIPIVGDFLPAVAGIAVGITLLLELYQAIPAGRGHSQGDETGDSPARTLPRGAATVERLLTEHKGAIGIAGIIAGMAHFLFPMVLFL